MRVRTFRWTRSTGHGRFVCPVISGFLMLFFFSSPGLLACEGEPVAPTCGRTLVLGLGTPANFLATGGPITFEALVYLGVSEFPLGSGLCPPGPYFVDLDFTVTCTPSGDATGGAMDIPVLPGFNELEVELILPPGPPRICSIDAAAAVEFSDGATVTASGGAQMCMVEPAPADPTLPRLDLEFLDPALARVHPGDQAGHRVRLTNRDASESWSGTIEALMTNRSVLPDLLGPLPLGHGVYGIADPVGDHFPLAFADDLQACLPLPPEPQLVPVSTISRPIDLLPGGVIELEIISRPWGMCADGSCGQGQVLIDGLFTDATDGFACSGFATAADIGVPPGFQWPDTGSSVLMSPPMPGVPELPFQGVPGAGLDPFDLIFLLPQADLLLDGQPPIPAQPLPSQLDPERGRIQLGFEDQQGLFPVGQGFGFGFRLELPPDPLGDVAQTELLQMQLVPNAPTGLADIGPLITGLLGARRGAGLDPVDVFFDLVLRLSGQGIDDLGQPHQILFQDVQVLPQPGSHGADFFLQAQPAPGSLTRATGTQIERLEIFVDFRAHAKIGEELLADDFESGDTSAWSSSVP